MLSVIHDTQRYATIHDVIQGFDVIHHNGNVTSVTTALVTSQQHQSRLFFKRK